MDNTEKPDSTKMDVFFRGDLAPGENVVAVRERLQKLFNASDDQVQRMFSGRPIAIRRDIERDEAEQYRDALLKAGALVELRPAKISAGLAKRQPITEASSQSSQHPDEHDASQQEKAPAQPAVQAVAQHTGAQQEAPKAQEQSPEDDDTFSIAPVGADVLRDEDRRHVEAVKVDISGLAVEALEGDILQDSEKKQFEPADLDISHLSVEELPPE